MTFRRAAAQGLALAGLCVFVACVIAEHAITPSLDPARHQISEYANAQGGTLMVAGFVAWAISLVATAVVLQRVGVPRGVVPLLLAAAAGVLVTAWFPTQTVAGELPRGETRTTAGRLHDFGSGVASLALLAAAIASTAGAPRGFQIRTGVLISVAVFGSATLLAAGPDVAGIRQRLVLLTACLWQLLAIRMAQR